ncbi:MAG: CsbD family protein [Candidatus Methanoperedens sp.]|nr:CsbD family protein [Candidatus Methanoperedens sp.]
MKSSTQDKVESNIHKAKGEIKEVAGKLTKNTDLEIEGKEEKIEGKIQEKVGQIKKVFGK